MDDKIQSAAFDFAFRYTCRDAVNNSSWKALVGTTSATNSTYNRYAVTFIENHDTEYRSASAQQDPIKKDTLALNAWLLANPGTPCVFFKHWQAYKKELKAMIEARKLVGINNQSTYTDKSAMTTYCIREVQGTKSSLLVIVGPGATGVSVASIYPDYKVLLRGYHYLYLVPNSFDTTGWEETLQRIDTETFVVPEETFTPYDVTINVSTDVPSTYASGYLNYWVWDDTGTRTTNTSWPGDKVTTTTEHGGKTWFTQTYTISKADTPLSIVLSTKTGSPQTVDFTGITEDKYLVISSTTTSGKNTIEDVTDQYSGDDAPAKLVGGDISLLPQYEAHNSGYLDLNGQMVDDLITWLKNECGWNAFRVRLFVNPNGKGNDGTSSDPAVCQDLDYVTKLGKRIKDAGAQFLLDFHYSDTWVDAGHIQAPEAWQSLSKSEMATQLGTYTKSTLETLKAAGAAPDYVQVGNEIMYGLCGVQVHPYAVSTDDWTSFLAIVKAGCDAVREVLPQAKIVLHTDRPCNSSYNSFWYGKMDAANVPYDVIGLSYYPFWHGQIADLGTSLASLATTFPDKKVQIVETAYNYQWWPTSGINYDTRSTWACSVQGQYNFVSDLVDKLNGYSNVNGLYYWFPEEAGNGDDTGNSVIPGWVNRGLWNDDRTTTGHPLNIAKDADGNNAAAVYLMKKFVGDTPDGIEAITGAATTATRTSACYNLAGQRVGSDYRGLVIQNGRKSVRR